MRRVQRGRGLFTGCPVYETMEERGILDMKRRIIDFHTHLGDIFHDSRNIVFHPQLHFPPYPDPFEDLARDHYSRALVTENQEEQNILIDVGQLRTWEYGSLEATQKALDETISIMRCRCPLCRIPASKKRWPPQSWSRGCSRLQVRTSAFPSRK